VGRGLRALAELARRWIVHRGNKVAYLRGLGARIGRETAILNDVQGFGTEPWLVEIGDRVTITAGVVFLTHDGSSRVFRHRIPEGSAFGNVFGAVRVLDNSFVGVNAILLPGVTVGPNSIVGAGSVVSHDVAPETVAAGVPARTLCSLDEYVGRYRARMIPGLSSDRAVLRAQLEARLMESRP
jgi:acetyltransferase-like isoleucine patch superfamily enzyme